MQRLNIPVQHPEQIVEGCAQGQAARAVAGHGLNARSSRSHTVFTLWVETVDFGTLLVTPHQRISAPCSALRKLQL